MGEGTENDRDRSVTNLAVPTWLIYLVAAVVWPLLLQVLIVVPGMFLSLVNPLAGWISALVIPLAVFFVAGWIGRSGRLAGIPRSLWLVPAVWAVVASAFSLFGYFLSDARDVIGLFGVLGTYVLGAFGFWLGMTRGKTASGSPEAQSRI